MDWGQLVAAVISGGLIKGVFDYFRGVKKDVNQLTLATLEKTLQEQERWRVQLMERLDEQDKVIAELKLKNAEMRLTIETLKAENEGWQKQKEELENRVKELEDELKRYHDEREALRNGKGD